MELIRELTSMMHFICRNLWLWQHGTLVVDDSEYIPLHLSGGGLGVFADKWNFSEFLKIFSGLVFSKQVFLLFSSVPEK